MYPFASFAGKADRTCTTEAVYKIRAYASVLAGIGAAFIDIRLAMATRKSGHANAAKSTSFINACPFILAWVGFALVNVHLTAPSLETGQAVASVRAWHIHTGSTMFTRRALIAFVDVNVAFRTNVTARTTTSVTAVDHASLANGSRITGVGGASIIQMAKEASLVRRTLTNIAGYAVVAGAPIEARLNSAVIHIDLAVVALETVDTDAGVTSVRVVTRGSVLAYVRPRRAFVDVLSAVAAGVLGGAVAGVTADTIHTTASVLAKVAIAIVYVDVAS